MVDKALYTSKSAEGETPQALYDLLDAEFGFTLDVAASAETTKCVAYFSKENSAFNNDWGQNVCWMNPPYGRDIGKWMELASCQCAEGATVVCLVPARTDTQWWWNWVRHADQIRFLKGRLKFGGAESSAPFPSAIIVYDPPYLGPRRYKLQKPKEIWWWNWKAVEPR